VIFRKDGCTVVVSDHKGDIKPGTLRSDDRQTWWISLPGVTSAADRPEQIAAQAQDALATAFDAGAGLPPAIEDGVIPPYDLADYHNPLVVLVAFATSAVAGK
jgi:hypothetical protein